MKNRPPITDAELLARDHAEPGAPGYTRLVNGRYEFFDGKRPQPYRYGWLKLALAVAATVTMILLGTSEARAGVDEVLQAEQSIEAAKEAKKAAVKRLSKIEKAELRVLLAQRALEKAHAAPAKKAKADAE